MNQILYVLTDIYIYISFARLSQKNDQIVQVVSSCSSFTVSKYKYKPGDHVQSILFSFAVSMMFC